METKEIKTFEEIIKEQEKKEPKLPYTDAEIYSMYIGKKDKYVQLQILAELNGLKITDENLEIIKRALIRAGVDKSTFPSKPLEKPKKPKIKKEKLLPYTDEEIYSMYINADDPLKKLIKIAKLTDCIGKQGKPNIAPIKKALIRAGVDPSTFPKSKKQTENHTNATIENVA